jgi:hypothetical protein
MASAASPWHIRASDSFVVWTIPLPLCVSALGAACLHLRANRSVDALGSGLAVTGFPGFSSSAPRISAGTSVSLLELRRLITDNWLITDKVWSQSLTVEMIVP